jgi:hypothetical protein
MDMYSSFLSADKLWVLLSLGRIGIDFSPGQVDSIQRTRCFARARFLTEYRQSFAKFSREKAYGADVMAMSSNR